MNKIIILLVILCAQNAFAQRETTTIVFLRHAEKGYIGSDPHLTEKGEAQAACIAEMLSFLDITTVYSSPYNRTRQTAQPIADNFDVEVQEYEPSNDRFIDEVKKKHNGEVIVVVGHSNTIPLYLNAVIGTSDYQPMAEDEYDKIFVVVTTSYSPVEVITLKIPCKS